MRLLKRIQNKRYYWHDVLRSKAAKLLHRPPNVMSWQETINVIVENHFSLSRNGDGEIDIMLGYDIPFQKYNARLALIMREAVSAYLPNYLSSLPDIFNSTDRLNIKAKEYYKRYLQRKRYGYYKFAKAKKYGDSFISRFYIDLADKSIADAQVAALKSIWDEQNVILVEGEGSRLGVNNDLFANAASLQRILGPSTDAFNMYDDLMKEVKSNATKENTLILLALGPTATAMSYELAKDGYWAVDIGHVDIEYEWYLMKAETKIAIPGKYTNEAVGDKLLGSLPQEALDIYYSQIIAKVL